MTGKDIFHDCPNCDFTTPSKIGLGVHRRKMHGHSNGREWQGTRYKKKSYNSYELDRIKKECLIICKSCNRLLGFEEAHVDGEKQKRILWEPNLQGEYGYQVNDHFNTFHKLRKKHPDSTAWFSNNEVLFIPIKK